MNIFRFLGDLSHIVSFLVLLHKIIKGKSSAGISLRTQELYAGVCWRSAQLLCGPLPAAPGRPPRAGSTRQAVLEPAASARRAGGARGGVA